MSPTPSTSSSLDNICSICLDTYSVASFTEGCLHKFCGRCILEWAQRSKLCPICRTKFDNIITNVISDYEYELIPLAAVRVQVPSPVSVSVPDFINEPWFNSFGRNPPLTPPHPNAHLSPIQYPSNRNIVAVRQFPTGRSGLFYQPTSPPYWERSIEELQALARPPQPQPQPQPQPAPEPEAAPEPEQALEPTLESASEPHASSSIEPSRAIEQQQVQQVNDDDFVDQAARRFNELQIDNRPRPRRIVWSSQRYVHRNSNRRPQHQPQLESQPELEAEFESQSQIQSSQQQPSSSSSASDAPSSTNYRGQSQPPNTPRHTFVPRPLRPLVGVRQETQQNENEPNYPQHYHHNQNQHHQQNHQNHQNQHQQYRHHQYQPHHRRNHQPQPTPQHQLNLNYQPQHHHSHHPHPHSHPHPDSNNPHHFNPHQQHQQQNSYKWISRPNNRNRRR